MMARFITLTRIGDATSCVVNAKHIERICAPLPNEQGGGSRILMASGDSFRVTETVPEIVDQIEDLPYK